MILKKTTFIFLFISIFITVSADNIIDIYEYIYKDAQEFQLRHGKETNIIRNRIEPSIGHKKMFWAMEPVTFKFDQVNAVLRKKSEHCLIYVEEGQNVSSSDLERFAKEFDNKIYPNNRKNFGYENSPGIDGDNRITMLFLDIKDGYNPEKSTGFIAGYYLPKNEYSKEKYEYSNECEMLYIDTYPSNPASEFSLSVIAHEFQHMIHWNNDPEEDIWLNEACSQIAIELCGYKTPGQVNKYSKNPELSLTQWHPDYMAENYGITFMFFKNIIDNFYFNQPEKFTSSIVKNTKKGLLSIKDELENNGVNITISELFNEFNIKNIINHPLTDYFYDQKLKDFKIIPLKNNTYSAEFKRDKVLSYGADFLSFEHDYSNGPEALVFEFDGVSDSAWSYFPDPVDYNIFAIKYLKEDVGNTLDIERLYLDSENDCFKVFEDFGVFYDKIDILITNTTSNQSVAYRYRADLRIIEKTETELRDKIETLVENVRKSIKSSNKDAYYNYINIIEKLEIEIERKKYQNIRR